MLGFFYSTRHFFQAEINGISPAHIGFVQEPILDEAKAIKLGSHSQRMERLGAHLDSLGPDIRSALTPGEFATASALGNVDPVYPYLVVHQ